MKKIKLIENDKEEKLGSQFGGGWGISNFIKKPEEQETEEEKPFKIHKIKKIKPLTEPIESPLGIGAKAEMGIELPELESTSLWNKIKDVAVSIFGTWEMKKKDKPELQQLEDLASQMKALPTRKEQESFCYQILTGKKIDDIFTLPLEERKKALSLMTQLQNIPVTTTEKFNDIVSQIGWLGLASILGYETVAGIMKVSPIILEKIKNKEIKTKLSPTEAFNLLQEVSRGKGTPSQIETVKSIIKQAHEKGLGVGEFIRKGVTISKTVPRFAFGTKLYAGLPADEIAKSIIEAGKVSAEAVKDLDPVKVSQVTQQLLNVNPALANEFLKAVEKPEKIAPKVEEKPKTEAEEYAKKYGIPLEKIKITKLPPGKREDLTKGLEPELPEFIRKEIEKPSLPEEPTEAELRAIELEKRIPENLQKPVPPELKEEYK